MQFLLKNILNHIKSVRLHQIYKNKLIFLFSKSGDDIEEKFATKMEFVNEPEVAIKIEPEYEVKIEEPEYDVNINEPEYGVNFEEPEFYINDEDSELNQPPVEYNLEEHVGDNIFYENNVDADRKLCEICNMTFSTKGNLTAHFKRIHLGLNMREKVIKNTKCEICNKDFGFPSRLKLHFQDVHEGRRDHACPQCEKSFSKSYRLNEHIQTVHEGIKKEGKHKCDSCEMSFPVPSKLKRHIARKHGGIKEFQCCMCPKAYG